MGAFRIEPDYRPFQVPQKSEQPLISTSKTDGPTVFRHACNLGLEGIVSKRKDSSYRSGRSPDWPTSSVIASGTLFAAALFRLISGQATGAAAMTTHSRPIADT
jgi:hypothetical protein